MTMIYVPHRKLWKPDPIELPFKVRGKFRLQTFGPDRKLRKDTGWFPNLIVNHGLDALVANANYLEYCAVGTGNSTPINTDTTLDAQIAYTGSNGGTGPNNSGASPYYGYCNVTYQFAQGAAAGNLQEVGILANSSTACFSRALILNNVGAPTTLTVLSNEFLTVSYTLELYVPTVDVSGTVVVAGTTCNYTLRAAQAATQWNLAGNAGQDVFGMKSMALYADTTLQPITGALLTPNASSTQDSIAQGTYTAGQYYLDGTATFGLGKGNSGNNNSAMIGFGQTYGQMGSVQCIFGATIPKTSSQIMTLTFRQTWGRYP